MRVRSILRLLPLVLLPLWAAPHAACGAKKGAIMLAISTDMKAPKDVNLVSVHIQTGSAVKHNFIGRVTPEGEVLLPATLAIAEPDDPNQSIRVRVIAFQETKPRVLRDVRTTVPRDGRIALLRMPLAFVNDGISVSGSIPAQMLPAKSGSSVASDAGAPGDGGVGQATLHFTAEEFNPYDPTQGIVPGCANPDETYIDGVCKDSFVDSSTLPEYSEEAVFGQGGLGACFDPKTCFQGATPIGGATTGNAGAADAGVVGRDGPLPKDLGPRADRFDLEGCRVTFDAPKDASKLNFALVTSDTGECLESGKCYVPIDQGDAGWKAESPTAIAFAPALCAVARRRNAQLYVREGACPAKTAANPICPAKAGEVSKPPVTPPANARLFPESFVTDLEAIGPTVLTVGNNGMAAYDLDNRGAARIAIPGMAPGQNPAVIGTRGAGLIAARTGAGGPPYLFLDLSPEGVKRTPPTVLSQLPEPLNDVAAGGSFLAFAVGGAAAGGFYSQSPPGPGNATKINASSVDATSVAATLFSDAESAIFGDAAGNLTECTYSEPPTPPFCNPPARVAQGVVDSITQIAPGGNELLVVVRGAGMFRALRTGPGAFAMTSLGSEKADGIPGSAGTRPVRARVGVTTRCAVYGVGNAVRYTTLGSGPRSAPVVAAPGPVSAVWTADGAPFLLYAVYADAEGASGGIYEAPLPAECITTGGPGPADGGAIGDGGQ